MIVASFAVCEKGFDLMSFQNPHRAGPWLFRYLLLLFIYLLLKIMYFIAYLKKKNQGLFSHQRAGGFACQTLTSLNELPA